VAEPNVMTDACPTEDALADFIAGVGDDATRTSIEAHIDTCTRCAETLALFGGAYATSAQREAQAAPEPEPPPAESFAGRYKIRECVGAGAGGTVYAAWDPELDRVVALKVLRGQATGGSSGAHRIAREARVMAKVVHPNVVAVHDVGSTGEHVFIAAEFVQGGTL
jgi:anti-sigma factor RsiW